MAMKTKEENEIKKSEMTTKKIQGFQEEFQDYEFESVRYKSEIESVRK